MRGCSVLQQRGCRARSGQGHGQGQGQGEGQGDRQGDGDPAAALACLERAARAPRLDAARFDIALRASQVALRIDRGAPALEAADRALAIEPYSPHAWAARAAAKLSLGDETQAALDATRAMKLFFDLPSAQTTLKTVRKLEAVRGTAAVEIGRRRSFP